MTWYAASLVKSVFVRNGEQSEFPVFESVFLIEASSFDEAVQKAESIGHLESEADDNLTYCGVSAYSKFLGIRKIKKTHNLDKDGDIGSAAPSDGTEILSSYFEIADKGDLQKFAEGKRVVVSYIDDDD